MSQVVVLSVCCILIIFAGLSVHTCAAVCCSVLKYVAVRCSVLQCVAMCCSVPLCVESGCIVSVSHFICINSVLQVVSDLFYMRM